MLSSRVLPSAEWDRLADTPPYDQQLPDPNHWLIVVVEEDGRIVASCAIFDTVHWDVFHIHPDYQKNPAVARHLLAGSFKVIEETGAPSVHLTIPADRPDLQALAVHYGFVESPFRLYIRGILPTSSAEG